MSNAPLQDHRHHSSPLAAAVSRALVIGWDRDDLVQSMIADGFSTSLCLDPHEAADRVRRDAPDVVVLDLASASIRGMELCRTIAGASDAYLVVCFDAHTESERIALLVVGADVVLPHVTSAREIVAHAMVGQRRRRPSPVTSPDSVDNHEWRSIGGLELDLLRRSVHIDGEIVELTRIEFDLLATLTARPGIVWARQALMRTIWGPNWFGAENVLDTHMSHLRRKIDRSGRPSLIATVRGVGYRCIE